MKSVLGTMTFGDQVDQTVAASIVSAFRDAGYNELDTAYMYCGGDTEQLLGELNKEGGLARCEIATKVNPKAVSYTHLTLPTKA